MGLRWPSLTCVGLRWPLLAADAQNDTPTSHHDSLMLSLAGHGWVRAGKDEKTHPRSSGVGGGSCDGNRSDILSTFKLVTIKQRRNKKYLARRHRRQWAVVVDADNIDQQCLMLFVDIRHFLRVPH